MKMTTVANNMSPMYTVAYYCDRRDSFCNISTDSHSYKTTYDGLAYFTGYIGLYTPTVFFIFGTYFQWLKWGGG